ncbi:hypothetical protein OS493_027093 [Desmophyllum pertusum]|uniref:Uncharacterized protein n=1 Tax=Desmophyllum pertusum TaxID=174260 RepID=A0A9X0CFD8_9CNID|nr:hypothetical protein OS493_027093 [Desmophyllum pertusum]
MVLLRRRKRHLECLAGSAVDENLVRATKEAQKHGSSDSLKNSSEFERRGIPKCQRQVPECQRQVPKYHAASAEVEIAKPQSGSKARNEAEREEESLVVERSSEVKIISTVHSDLAEDKDIKKPGTKPEGEDDSSPKEDIVSEKLAKEALMEESMSFQEQTPVASKSQTFEFNLQSSVILSEGNKNAEESKKKVLQLKD